MSRRARAVAFLALAGGCAALAAALANGYGASVAQSFGPLRAVVIASHDLAAGEPIGPADLSRSLALRRIPSRFVPPGALSVPQQALGREPAGGGPRRSYLLA